MYDPAQKCENYAIFKQNYTLELFISLKMAICCCFGLRENLEFPDFLQKKSFTTSTAGHRQPVDQDNGKAEKPLCLEAIGQGLPQELGELHSGKTVSTGLV